MFGADELRDKGAKRAVLEYIVSQDSSIPVPKPVSADQINPGTVLRSDHWREFDDFYGIFESVFVGNEFREPHFTQSAIVTNPQQGIDFMFFRETGMPELDKYSRRKKKVFEAYCRAKGLNPDEVLSEFKVFPQEAISSRTNGTVLLHPNVPNRYLIYVQKTDDIPVGFIVDAEGNNLKIIRGEWMSGVPPLEMMIEHSPVNISQVNEIVNLYRRVSSLPKFQDGFSYMMEFSTDPTYVFQMRRFRKLEDGSEIECSWKNDKDTIKTNLAFGVTAPEGLVLPYFGGGHTIGPQILTPDWNEELHQFNHDNPRGFADESADTDQYSNVFLSNLKCAMAGGFVHYAHHGGMEDMAKLPVYLLDVKNGLRESKIPSGSLLRIFSNGLEGYIKIADHK